MTETQQLVAVVDFEPAEVTAEDHWVLRIAQRADQTLVFPGKEAGALALVCHWRVLMKKTKSHRLPLVNQEVETTSQESEGLNFENALLCMVVIEIVAAVNQAMWVDINISEKRWRSCNKHSIDTTRNCKGASTSDCGLIICCCCCFSGV